MFILFVLLLMLVLVWVMCYGCRLLKTTQTVAFGGDQLRQQLPFKQCRLTDRRIFTAQHQEAGLDTPIQAGECLFVRQYKEQKWLL
jgi:hypothetical protein